MSRTQNVAKMVFASAINQAIIMISGLILPPLLIKHYGSEINGLVNSIKQILNYFQVVSVGIGAAGQVALYEPLAKKDQNKINRIMTELSLFLYKAGFLFCLLVGIVAISLPLIRNDGIPKRIIASIVLICGAGSFVEFTILTKYKILLTADQKQYIASKVNTEGTVINVILSVMMIYIGAPIIVVQLVATFAYVVRMILLVLTIKKLYPDLNMNVYHDEREIPNQKDALLYKLTDIIINYTPMTIVMLICGFNDVSIYTVYNLVFSAIVMIVHIFSNGFASAFGNQIAEGNYTALRSSYYGYNFGFRTLTYWLYASSAALIIPFVSIYIRNTDGVNYLMPAVGICFALNGLFRAIRTPSITIIDAKGNYKENLKLNYIEAGLNLTLSITLTLRFGMIGVLIGGLISALFRSVCFIWTIDKNVVGIPFSKDILLHAINTLIGIITCVLFRNLTASNVLDWLLIAIYVSFVNGVLLTTTNVVLDKQGFHEFIDRAKKLVNR